MPPKLRLWSKRARENRPYYSSNETQVATVEEGQGEIATLTGTQESNENESSSINEHKEVKPIAIDSGDDINSIAFLANGEHFVSRGNDGNIRCWGMQDGKEVGTPMEAGRSVFGIAVSHDGKWIASGTRSGRVTVWNAESHDKVCEFKGHGDAVFAVDISPDATKLATGSNDGTASVWSLSTCQRLLGPFKHDNKVGVVKFSPDGRLFATSTLMRKSIRVYDSQDDRLLVDISIETGSSNESLAWVSDSKQLFALSRGGNIRCLDVFTGQTLSKWAIHSSKSPGSITLTSDGAFIAASDDSSVSFWDTTTRQQIGSLIHHPADIESMTISADYDLLIGGGKKITLWDLLDILPSRHRQHILEIRRTKAEKAALKETILSLRTQDQRSNKKIANLKRTVQILRTELADSRQKADSLTEILCAHQQKHQSEILYADGRVMDAAQLLLEIARTASDDVKVDTIIIDWLSGFTRKCVIALERIGDEASKIKNYDEALAAYSTSLSLSPSTPNGLLTKWANTMMLRGSTSETLDVATKFKLPRFTIYRALCDILEGDSRVTEAVGCFRQMQSALTVDTGVHNEQAEWEPSFQRRCRQKLEKLADVAMGSQNYNEAAEHFSTILSLDPADCVDALMKRSKARVMMNSWEDAVKDADEVVKLDPSSHRGYEQRHAALHGAGRHAEAVEALGTMLLRLEESTDEHVRELRSRYVDARPAIRHTIDATVSHIPRVLIDTTTGQLHDRTQQAEAFEALPIFNELVSSMMTGVDYARILREVKQFYRYVMLSHKWGLGEPLLQKVEHITVYELEVSPANTKLQSFCSVARSLGFRWAWSDTCCIDKGNSVILQESLVAAFSWYRGSSLTLVYLLGVPSKLQKPGGLQRSIWNTRVWTYQEYVAAQRVLFYTEDWKPYLGLTLSNHKESPIVIAEMEQASQVSAEQLAVLKPGLDRVREKLHLASMRQTTLVEDIAYSLLGIFNVVTPIIYGEGTRAVGRLLEHILTGSGDVAILAWTGTANDYNSCLPTNLAVYSEIVAPHIPPFMETAEVDRMVTKLRSCLPDLSLATALYDRLNDFPSPILAVSRLRLPGIVCRVTEVVHVSGPDPEPETKFNVYHATTAIFGGIEIKTTNNLATMKGLYLVHPWIRPLLDQEFSRPETGLDETVQALRMVARLREPFGALLFEQKSRVEYMRVAADSLIMAQVHDDVPLSDLIDSIRTMDVQ